MHGILTMLIFIPTLVFWISDPKSIFGQIWAKKVKLVHFTWKLVHVISRFLILVPILVFWISKPKSIFGQICKFGPKNSKLSSLAEIGTQNVSTMLILIPTLLFPTSFSGKIWAEKFKVVHFDWKLAHMVYRGRWFLFQQQFFELPTLNQFLGKFGLKMSKLFLFPENWHTSTYTHSISKMLILISILVFSNFKPKSWRCWFLFWD